MSPLYLMKVGSPYIPWKYLVRENTASTLRYRETRHPAILYIRRVWTLIARWRQGDATSGSVLPAGCSKLSLPRFGRLQDTRPSQLSSGRPALASFPRDRGAGFLLIFPAEGNYLEPLKPPGVYSSSFPICNPRRQPGPHYGLNREVLLAACRLPLFSATRRPESNRQTLALSGMHRVPAARPLAYIPRGNIKYSKNFARALI